MNNIDLMEAKVGDEIDFAGYEVHIEANPDYWHGGFVWSVSLGIMELDSGLEFSRSLAQVSADQCVSRLKNKLRTNRNRA